VRVEDDPLIGVELDGRFKLTERLGSGAMGVVYRAIQLSIGRDVAVKVISNLDATAVKRFFREAQIASALSHPNTVPIIEFGEHSDGRVYIAMELVKGRTLLDESNAAGPFAPRRLCRVGIQLCDALDTAHRQTIVHRDLKLENVMIANDGSDHVKILDFGIARVLGDATSRVTRAGLSAGTPGYMAPEVLGKGAEPEPPQDMYALGVMLAELSLGRPLWTSKVLEALYLEKLQNTALDAVGPRVRAIVKRLMDPDPALRPTAAETRELLRQLDRIATDPAGIAATADLAPLEIAPPSIDLPAIELPAQLELEPTGAPEPMPPHAPEPPREPMRAPEIKLEAGWEQSKARTPGASVGAQRVAAEAARRPASSSINLWPLAVLIVIAGLGAGAYYMFLRKHEPRQDPDHHLAPERGISIRITGDDGTPVTIDGAYAGKTPLSLKRKPGKKAFVIGANGRTWKIVPDRDQLIDVSP
jgi:hypothetical protein